ncbi:hypothetical protein C8R45DRAFT_1160169 [Mycena sanguinolenta]|nr:hypothetical protein C8R45DRAFT_1160169 [Mycena sanguinolenta]
MALARTIIFAARRGTLPHVTQRQCDIAAAIYSTAAASLRQTQLPQRHLQRHSGTLPLPVLHQRRRMVVQLAKRDGLTVIASAGSDEKVKFMKRIGADVTFNYKTTNTREVLEREGPVDDNVGGEILEAAPDNANAHGRPIARRLLMNDASQIDNNPLRRLQYWLPWHQAKSFIMSGIFVSHFHHKYEREFYKVIPAALASGELKYYEDLDAGKPRGSQPLHAARALPMRESSLSCARGRHSADNHSPRRQGSKSTDTGFLISDPSQYSFYDTNEDPCVYYLTEQVHTFPALRRIVRSRSARDCNRDELQDRCTELGIEMCFPSITTLPSVANLIALAQSGSALKGTFLVYVIRDDSESKTLATGSRTSINSAPAFFYDAYAP